MKQQAVEASEHPAGLLQFAQSLVSPQMQAVDRTIHQRLKSDIALINTLGTYIVKSGGKRLRPLILLLCARCGGYNGPHHISLAAVVELIHTATLLHDDVVDASATRRDQPTANEVWGNEASVLVGDFLYSRAFEIMVETQNMAVMEIMAATTNAIAEGEVLQLLNAHTPETDQQQYLKTIQHKTAKLFESAAKLGAVIAQMDEEQCQAMAKYGMYLGTAFQLTDDILDYTANPEDTGKDIGNDLAEGKPTLPLIHAMENGNADQRAIIIDAIRSGKRSRIGDILHIVRETGSLDFAYRKAVEQVEDAKNSLCQLEPSEFKRALLGLADFTVLRGY